MAKSIYAKMVILMIITSFIATSAVTADTPAVWGDLTPGQYGIGFKTVETFDDSRVILPKEDYFGRPINLDERRRPIQICIWYPAITTPDQIQMSFSEYAFPYPENEIFLTYLSEVQTREIGFLQRFFANDGIDVLDVLSVEVAAIRDAESVEGKFPLVIYDTSPSSSISENFIMCEFLASHGYIVAVTHSVGTSELNQQFTSWDVETSISDLEFVFGKMREFPNVDNNNIAAMGFSAGGMTSLLFQMRNSDIGAVVGLDPANLRADSYEMFSGNPYFNIDKASKPILQLYREGLESLNEVYLDELTYSKRLYYKSNLPSHMDFTSYPILGMAMTLEPTDELKHVASVYRSLCGFVVQFFDVYLKKDDAAIERFTGKESMASSSLSIAHLPSKEPAELPPTPSQFMQILQTDGIAKAHELYEKSKDIEPDRVFFIEADFNMRGYQAMGRGFPDDALLYFKMNTEAYPQSPNVWDSYGEALEAAGRNDEAIVSLKKVLELLETDTTTPEAFKAQIREHAETAIARMQGEGE